jgi:hypothetical protein
MPKKFGLWVAAISIINLIPIPVARAVSCPDLKIIFARGSGGERWMDQNYLTFKSGIEEKLKLINLNYEFEDLDYPAVGVGNLFTLLETFVSGGEAYEFGESVDIGTTNLVREINNNCPNTKYIIGGYSQGAMVVSRSLKFLNPEKIVYAATFGDPKIYLPEGYGPVPAACSGKNLSSYRIYVPDCRVYEGMLGSYRPYQPEGFENKLGTWCNKMDIFCSTHFSINSHVSYVSDGLYEDASKLIFDKVCKSFEIENNYISLHDTAILIDSTSSMQDLIADYKNEALRLAEKTLSAGGRVALYDYGDLGDPYEPVEHCNFETCTLEIVEYELNKISVQGGGDAPESLLSASFNVMKKLNWQYGSTKSVVVLTDALYHNPDLDGVIFNDVVTLSKSIDPVNFYIISPYWNTDDYDNLATATGGRAVSSASDLSLLTNEIITRYDALPRVEDFDVNLEPLPAISDFGWEMAENGIKINFSSSSGRAMVVLDDSVLGIVEGNSIMISDLDFQKENMITLIPISNTTRGESVKISLGLGELKVPNSGRR